MSEQLYTTRRTVTEDTRAKLNHIKVKKDRYGNFSLSALTDAFAEAQLEMKNVANPGDPNGWAAVSYKTGDWAAVLSSFYCCPDEVFDNTTDADKLKIKTAERAENFSLRKNQKNEAGLGAKYGFMEWLLREVGSKALSSVLLLPDGITKRAFDLFTINKHYEAAKEHATPKSLEEISDELVALVNFTFDFRISFQRNLGLLVLAEISTNAYSHPDNIPRRVLTIMRNIKAAAKQPWGEPFKDAIAELKKAFPKANKVHDDFSLAIVTLTLTTADALRDRNEAPAPMPRDAVNSVTTDYSGDDVVSALSATSKASASQEAPEDSRAPRRRLAAARHTRAVPTPRMATARRAPTALSTATLATSGEMDAAVAIGTRAGGACTTRITRVTAPNMRATRWASLSRRGSTSVRAGADTPLRPRATTASSPATSRYQRRTQARTV